MENYNIKKRYINNSINEIILNPLKTTFPTIYDIMRHALEGGKRLRSVITLTVGEALNSNVNIDKLALCVELLHNTSLIIDDMPCMDNDNYRRGKKTTHYKY